MFSSQNTIKEYGKKEELKHFLDSQYVYFNAQEYLKIHPDPICVVYQNKDFFYFDELALLCALYAYGNAKMIVKNLLSMPFHFLLEKQLLLQATTRDFPYYRFQTREDTKACFLILLHMIENGGVKSLFLESYQKRQNILDGITAIQEYARSYIVRHNLESYGINFLFGNPKNKQAPLKRYNMFLRWMVRKDCLDFGVWHEVLTRDLLLPLDTHTFRISKQLGLCTTKSYNLSAVREITQNLRMFSPDDPVKYDFALYRIGQLGIPLLPEL